MKIEINSYIKNGALMYGQTDVNAAYSQFKDGPITLIIKTRGKPLSDPQRGYYFGCVIPIIQEAIYNEWGSRKTSVQVHNLLKKELLFDERINEETGEILKDPKSITENDTKAQEVYHEDVRRWAFEWFGVTIPLPEKQIKIKY